MVEKALTGFFKGSNLGALRELTLRQAAHEVDLRQSAYDETRGFQVPRTSEARPSGVVDNQPKERILIHITANPSTAMLIRRKRRVHSGSRGVGNRMGSYFIEVARKDMQKFSLTCRIRIWLISQKEPSTSTITWKRSNGRRILPVGIVT
jgi:K+-sensing histidine kinase KdpD